MQLRRLVFPAPLGPMIAFRAPRATEKLTSETAVTPPKRRATREMSRRGEDIRPETTPLRYRAKPAAPAPRAAEAARGDVTHAVGSELNQSMRMCGRERYFGASGVGGGGVAPGCCSAPAAPGAPGAAGCCDSCLMLSVIIPIVQPLDESRIASSAFTARTYFALSSASKKMTGGPCVASLLLASR